MSSSISLQKQPHALNKSLHLKRYFLTYVILLIIILGCFSSFWVAGNIFKSNYVKLISALNNDSKHTFKVIEYKQGWFHSTAKLFVPFDLPTPLTFGKEQENTTDNSPGFLIEQTITHGPFVHDAIQNKYAFAAAAMKSTAFFTQSPIGASKDNHELFNIQSLATFNNQLANHITTASANITFLDSSLQWSGLSGDINLASQQKHINKLIIEIASSPIIVKRKNYAFNLSGLTMKSDLTRNSTGFLVGHQSISIANASYARGDNKYSINHFNHSSEVSINPQNSYNYITQASIEEIAIPELTIKPMELKFSLTGINAQALNDFIEVTKKTDINNPSPETKQTFANLAARLLMPNTQLTLDIVNNTNLGKATLTAKVDLPQSITLPNTLETLKNNVRARMDITIATALANHLLTTYINKTEPVAAPIADNSLASLQAFQDELNHLQDDDKISTSTKTKITSIVQTKPTSETFATYIDQLVTMNEIPEDAANALKDHYQLVEKAVNDKMAAEAESPTTSDEPLTTQDKVSERITNYKNSGFIIEDNGNYTATIIFENNQLMINSKLINSEVK